MRCWTAEMERADALPLGRVTYETVVSAWRKPAIGGRPDWMDEWEIPVAEAKRLEQDPDCSPGCTSFGAT